VAASCATPAGILATTVPSLVIPVTRRCKSGRPARYCAGQRPAGRTTGEAYHRCGEAGYRFAEDTVKSIGLLPVGSVCVPAWLIVTVGATAS